MTYAHLTVEIDARGVARATMNRPEVKNAFNEALIADIAEAVAALSRDAALRAIVLAGAGDAFSAGADLSMMKRAGADAPEANVKDARRLADMLRAIDRCPKPVIALVNGAAIGGGVGLVAAADIAIAAEDAVFALSEARLGLVPAVISPFVVRAIGAREASRWFLTAERFDAETAKRIGLVHMTAMTAQLEATLDGVLKNLLAAGPIALAEAKALIRLVAGRAIDERLADETAGVIARLRASDEGREGVAAFLEKRKPRWVKG